MTMTAFASVLAALTVGVVLGATLTRKPAEKPKNKVSNVVLMVLGLFLFSFIVCMVVTFWVRGSVPDTLIQYTLGAGGLEAVVLAGIKISKVITGEKTGESEDV